MPLTRNAVLAGGVAVWVLVVLGLDTGASLGQQRLLGVGTWLLLLAALHGEDRATRVQVGVVVVYATVVEYVFSHGLGVYTYRLDGVPMFVPPSHGLVYLAALSFGRTVWAARHARPLLAAVLVVGGVWALWGLTFSPTPDAIGAFWYLCLVAFAWKGRSPLLYVGAFVVVSYLEIVGTSLGAWTWGAVDPVLGVITLGNPPSGIAGGYAFFDAAALYVTPRVLARWDARRPRGRGSVARPAAAQPPPRAEVRRSRRRRRAAARPSVRG